MPQNSYKATRKTRLDRSTTLTQLREHHREDEKYSRLAVLLDSRNCCTFSCEESSDDFFSTTDDDYC